MRPGLILGEQWQGVGQDEVAAADEDHIVRRGRGLGRADRLRDGGVSRALKAGLGT